MIEQDAAFTAAFEEIRGLIRADGGDLEVVSFDGSTVTISLILVTANCADCIMPRWFLEQVALDIFHQGGVNLEFVSIRDPRESSILPSDTEEQK